MTGNGDDVGDNNTSEHPWSVHFVVMTHRKYLTALLQKQTKHCTWSRSPQSQGCGISPSWSKIPAVSLKSPMTLRKFSNPFGLLSHLINGETSAHSAFLLPTTQLYRYIAKIRDGKAHQEPEPTLHTDKAGTGSGARSCSWFTAGLDLRPRRQNSQARQTELLSRSAQRTTETTSSWHGRLLHTETPCG